MHGSSQLYYEGSKDMSKSLSLDIDPDTASKHRLYPSVKEYYLANAKDRAIPVQRQKGLSNYSGLLLGDDRIGFNESILSGTYRVAVEDKMTITSPSKTKSKHVRMLAYNEASEKVGEIEINRLERVMKDKLFQRSYMTSSPFQVRKAFKFFDREQSGRISIEGFTRALEFLGFQFSEQQNTALFARFDPNYSGEIEYMSFIKNAMFYSPEDEIPIPLVKKAAPPKVEKSKESSEEHFKVFDFEETDLEILQKQELKKIFDKIDTSKTGTITTDQFELLMLAIGQKLTAVELQAYLNDMGCTDSVPFDVFADWWTSSAGATSLQENLKVKTKPATSGHH